MKNAKRTTLASIAIALLLLVTPLSFGQYAIDSYTIDAGGGYSMGGDFELEGTIGQPDAGPTGGSMIGGDFSLTGGFWAPTAAQCACLGDLDADGLRNGLDIQAFIECLLIGANCQCADIDGTNGATIDDIDGFASLLLSQTSCP